MPKFPTPKTLLDYVENWRRTHEVTGPDPKLYTRSIMKGYKEFLIQCPYDDGLCYSSYSKCVSCSERKGEIVEAPHKPINLKDAKLDG